VPPKCHESAILNEVNCVWICKDESHEVPAE
jgi:hypothetical protein